MGKAMIMKNQKEAVLGEVEDLLANMFMPVTPRPAYVKDLNRRLSSYPNPIPEVVTPLIRPDTIGFILGVIGGSVLIVLGIRVMVPLIASLTTYYTMRREMREKEAGLLN